MYLKILENTVGKYLSGKVAAPSTVPTISITQVLYDRLQLELMDIITFDTTIPIEGITICAVKLYGRTIRIEKSDKLDSIFESEVVKMLDSFKEAK